MRRSNHKLNIIKDEFHQQMFNNAIRDGIFKNYITYFIIL